MAWIKVFSTAVIILSKCRNRLADDNYIFEFEKLLILKLNHEFW